jgi:hypothetical protein
MADYEIKRLQSVAEQARPVPPPLLEANARYAARLTEPTAV